MTTNDYDAIIVGGGHNGLVSVAYFARSDARTLRQAKRDGALRRRSKNLR